MSTFKTILFASSNKGKLLEVREELQKYSIRVHSPLEIKEQKNLNQPPEVDENAGNYEGNAKLKADALFSWSLKEPSLADDSGLEVEALKGEPGVNTARYAGPNAGSSENIEKLLAALKNEENRKARFVCHLCLKIADNQYFIVTQELRGSIALELSGEGGFGYDPIFIPDGFSKSLAALKGEGIDVATHRIKALRELAPRLIKGN